MNKKKIEKLIDSQAIAFIGSVDAEGFPQVKAMLAPRIREGLSVFYFTTNTSSKRAAQYLVDNKACVYFCDENGFLGAMFTGRMEVCTDDYHRRLIWREGDTEYYSQGVDDPDYSVLKFEAKKCRVYENFSSEEFLL